VRKGLAGRAASKYATTEATSVAFAFGGSIDDSQLEAVLAIDGWGTHKDVSVLACTTAR